jgi:hypothetical protein
MSFVFASNYIPATQMLAGTPLNVLQSYLLVAAFIALLLLHARTSPATALEVKHSARATLSASPSHLGSG